MLEPCDGKLSRRVFRGERGGNAPDLPGAGLAITAMLGNNWKAGKFQYCVCILK